MGGRKRGITQITLTGSRLTGVTETTAPEFEEKRLLARDRGLQPFFRELSGHIFPASSSKDASAQGEAKEGDIQGQEGAEAGHAGGPAADHHSGAAHPGCGGAPDCGVRVCGHAPAITE